MSVSGRTDDDLPRLPPARRATPGDPTPGSARIRSDIGPTDRTGAIIRRMTWSEYVEPELLGLRLAGRIVLGTRVALAASAIGVVATAIALRSDSVERNVSTATVERSALIGVAVAAVAAIAGWYWTDRATRDVHRLAARLPTRRRCVTAWAAPLVWAVAMSFTVVRLDPTEPVDVRPAVAGAVLAAALWRPYAVVRRILKSLIRVDSDLVIASGYVLDLALFGLLWARLASLPDAIGPADRGVVGVLLGLAAVAAVAATAGVGAWWAIVRDVDRAVAHRKVAMRTRHEHRQLRLAGIDPLDPKVRLALMMIRQAEPRAEPAAARAVEPDGGGLRALRVEDARRTVNVTAAQPERPERTSDATWAAPARAEELAADAGPDADLGESPPGEWTGRGGTAVDADPGALPGEPTGEPTERFGIDPDRLARDRRDPGSGTDHPIRDRLARKLGRPDDSAADDPSARARLDGVARPLGGGATTGPDGPVLDRLGRALGGLGGDAGHEPRSIPDRLDRLASRLSDDPPPGASILERLERYGITPSEAVVHETGRLGGEPAAEAPLMIERVHGLEAVRYLLVLAIVVCAGAGAWFVGQSVDVGQVADGAIVPTAQDRLELARLVAIRALTIALVLVPLWCAVAARWAGRVGLPVRGATRCALLTVVAAGFAGAGVAADLASDVMLVAIVACLGAALWAVPVMIEIERRAGRGTTVPSLVPLALATAVGTAYLGRLLRPVEATDSLEAMSFVGGLLALVAAIAAVVTAVATGDAVEAIRLAPAAAERERDHAGRDEP